MLVTRCPHCGTSFHVNEQQLRAARGAVRCGSCLQVFRADENIVFTDGKPGANRDLETLLEDDDFLIHDDIDLDGGQMPVPPTVSTPDVAGKAENAGHSPLIDEAFGDSQWQEMAAAPAPEDGEEEGDGEEIIADDDDPWANDAPEPPPKRESTPAGRRKEDPRDEFTEQLRHVEAHAAAAQADNGTDFAINPRREQLIRAIEPAPLEVAWQPRRDRRISGWLGWPLALLLAAGIVAQIALFRFDSLSKQAPWRGLYSKVCPPLDCQLPPQQDLRAIHTSNLVVLSHPQTRDALVVDAVLLNTAPFDQPFPKLLLNFTDLKNKPVASRLFEPRDYLQGELAGRKQMPSGSPVHIAIEIVDPGSEAVNYDLRTAP